MNKSLLHQVLSPADTAASPRTPFSSLKTVSSAAVGYRFRTGGRLRRSQRMMVVIWNKSHLHICRELVRSWYFACTKIKSRSALPWQRSTKTAKFLIRAFSSKWMALLLNIDGCITIYDWSFLPFLETGYGDHLPITHAGQLFAIIFALSAIPLNFWLLKLIGEHILDGQKLVISKLEYLLLKRYPRFLPEKCVLVGVFFIWILVFTGAAIQTSYANWKFLHGVYCYVITFTTVGFGDLIPYHHPTKDDTAMRIFQVFYCYFGLCMLSNVLNGAFQAHELTEYLARRFGRGRGMQGAQMINEESDVPGTEFNPSDSNQATL